MIADILTFKGFAGWSCGETYDSLTWDKVEAGRSKPSQEDIKAWEVEYLARRNIKRTVTMRQARLALLQSGLLANVNAAVDAADEATKITWEFSSEVHRDHPFVATLAAALSLSEKQLDGLFTLAASL